METAQLLVHGRRGLVTLVTAAIVIGLAGIVAAYIGMFLVLSDAACSTSALLSLWLYVYSMVIVVAAYIGMLRGRRDPATPATQRNAVSISAFTSIQNLTVFLTAAQGIAVTATSSCSDAMSINWLSILLFFAAIINFLLVFIITNGGYLRIDTRSTTYTPDADPRARLERIAPRYGDPHAPAFRWLAWGTFALAALLAGVSAALSLQTTGAHAALAGTLLLGGSIWLIIVTSYIAATARYLPAGPVLVSRSAVPLCISSVVASLVMVAGGIYGATQSDQSNRQLLIAGTIVSGVTVVSGGWLLFRLSTNNYTAAALSAFLPAATSRLKYT